MKLKAIPNLGNDNKVHYASQNEMDFGTMTRYPICWDNYNAKNMRGTAYYTQSQEKVNCPECLKRITYIKSLEE